MLISIVVTIIALSMGAPGVPGGNLVCISILLPTIGIPAEAISIIMGIYSLVGMSQTMTNVTGDAVVTTIVAKNPNVPVSPDSSPERTVSRGFPRWAEDFSS